MIGRILGIDYGEKRVGLAMSDPLGITAQNLELLENTGEAGLIEAIGAVVRKHGIQEAVLGLPINMDGSRGPKAQHCEALAASLREALGIEVHCVDERLTTQQAQRVLIEADVSRKKRKGAIDRMAAVLILQGFLDSPRRSRRNLEEY